MTISRTPWREVGQLQAYMYRGIAYTLRWRAQFRPPHFFHNILFQLHLVL